MTMRTVILHVDLPFSHEADSISLQFIQSSN
jgi:hypothetical protein